MGTKTYPSIFCYNSISTLESEVTPMRVSCGAPRATASPGLSRDIEDLGLLPIVTTQTIRVVYEGEDQKLGDRIVRMFEKEIDHDITVDYTEKERRKALRKAERAVKNAKLHGH